MFHFAGVGTNCEPVFQPLHTERLDVIKNAYNESTVAAKKVNSTENTIKEVRDIREKMEDIQNQVQPNNTRDLSQLKNNMASQPDLTPAAKQVTVMADQTRVTYCI